MRTAQSMISRRLARRIRQLARERCIQMAELPKVCGVTEARLAAVLRGDASPTLRWSDTWRGGLGVDVAQLGPRQRRPREPALALGSVGTTGTAYVRRSRRNRGHAPTARNGASGASSAVPI
jgi:hypothetical protein